MDEGGPETRVDLGQVEVGGVVGGYEGAKDVVLERGGRGLVWKTDRAYGVYLVGVFDELRQSEVCEGWDVGIRGVVD